jgi:uncharacterized protein (DUF885 family)
MLIRHEGTKGTKDYEARPHTHKSCCGGYGWEFTVIVLAMLAACAPSPRPAPAPTDPAALVNRLADEYVAGVFERVPEQVTRRGLPGDHGRVFDNSLAALDRWRRREDAWLRALQAVDSTRLVGRPEWVTYGVLRELLESSVAVRVCRFELWNISTSVPGWQSNYTSLAGLQPVGTDSLRRQAVARIRALPRFLRTEQANLEAGLRLGYVAPKAVAQGVLRQLDGILASPPDSSPFASPAQRDSTSAFRRSYLQALADDLYPAIRAYRDFLDRSYLPHAREAIGVSANPNGRMCYQATVRQYTTLRITPEEVALAGEAELARVETEMRALASTRFGTSDLPALLRRLRQDTAFTFRSRGEIVVRSNQAIARAKAAMAGWFGRLPQADVTIVEYPEYRQREGAVASYVAPSEDGRRPGIFYITTWQPDSVSRATVEDVAFHEAIPGHHLQIAIAQERRDARPISRFFGFSGFNEGWALYAERLADEMGLYSGDADRMGMLSGHAWRAARLIVDAGIHAGGWTRQQAVDFLTAHTATAPSLVQGEVDRYISWPGQATSYMLGNLAILDLRRKAETGVGRRFDIRAFHDQVLGSGSITLPMLGDLIERWSAN